MTDLQKNEEQPRQELTPIQAKWQEANYLAQSSLLPKHFAGQPANVLVALELAKQLSTQNSQLSPISVMQNLYVVHGKTAMYAKFKIALANSSGKLDHQIKYRMDKNPNNLAVEAYSSIGGDEISFRVDMAMAKAEGWAQKNTKYQSMPMLMLTYRSASMLIDTHIPEVTMGIQTVDEAIDIEYADNPVKTTREDTKTLPEGDIIDEDLV